MENFSENTIKENDSLFTKRSKQGLVRTITDQPLVFALIVLVIIFYFMEPRFLSKRNIFNIVLQVSILAPVAIGQTMVILTGGIDLSVGSVLAFSSAYCASMLLAGYNVVLCIVVALAIGSFLGLCNGLGIAFLKIPPLIATLGMMSVARGLQLTHTLGATIYSFPKAFRYLAETQWIGIPAPIYCVILIFIIFHLIMRYTIMGRSIYAFGGNREAARISGISLTKVTLWVYTMAGLLTSIGGIILIMRMNASETSAGQGLELEAIAAVVIGGTSLAGGRGSVMNTFLGTLIYGIILNGLNIVGVNPFIQKMVIGFLIIGAVAADSIMRYRRGER